MPAASPSGVKRRRQRAGFVGDIGSVAGIIEASVLGESEGANATVAWMLSTVALLASGSFS
jgi:hypothetical protein